MRNNLYEEEQIAEEYITRRRHEAEESRQAQAANPHHSSPGLLRRLLAGLGIRMISTGERLRSLETYDSSTCETC